jgi:hypothetical protein
MARRDLTDDEKRGFRARFSAAGLSVVQIAISSGAYSSLVDHPEFDSRQFAKQWVAEELARTQRAARRNTRYLQLGTAAAVVAAIAAVVAAIPIAERWLRWAYDAL